MVKLQTLRLALLAGTMSMAPATVFAQTAQARAPAAAPAENFINEIVVTARRREENAQTVPLSIDAHSAQTLEQHQISDLYGLQKITPSLQSQAAAAQVGAANFAIRGIGTSVIGPQIESSVGIVVDDVPLARAQLGNIDLFDLGRVEVLSGPQGMLFGKNAAAGLVNITTAQPVIGRTELLARAEYGSMNTPTVGNSVRMNLAGNMPISETAALRVAGFYSYTDGYVKNVARSEFTGIRQFGLRAGLLWKPTDSFSSLLRADYAHEFGPGDGAITSSHASPTICNPFGGACPQPGVLAGFLAVNGVTGSRGNVFSAANAPITNEFDTGGVSWKAELGIGDGYSLTNVAGYRANTSRNRGDVDTSAADILSSNISFRYSQVTEELRLTSPSSGPFSFQTGLFFLALKTRNGTVLSGADEGGAGGLLLSTLLGRNTAPTPPPLGQIGLAVLHNDSYAAFFEGQYKITDSLRLTAGARYTVDDLKFETSGFAPPGTFFPPTPYNLTNSDTNRNFSYRVSLQYDLAPGVMAYVTYAKGYKGPTFDVTTAALVAPEIPKAIEGGVKSTLFNRRLRLNVVGFHEKFDGFQTQAQTSTAFQTVNAGSLISEGVEVQFTALPVDGLTVNGGVLYDHTEYQGLDAIACYYGQPVGVGRNLCTLAPPFAALVGTTNASGNQLALAPKWTASLTARYEHPVANAWTGFFQAETYFRSSFYYAPTQDPNTRVGDTATFGLSIGANSDDGRWTGALFVRNLTDKRTPAFVFQSPIGLFTSDALFGTGTYTQQYSADSFRTIGVSLGYRM